MELMNYSWKKLHDFSRNNQNLLSKPLKLTKQRRALELGHTPKAIIAPSSYVPTSVALKGLVS